MRSLIVEALVGLSPPLPVNLSPAAPSNSTGHPRNFSFSPPSPESPPLFAPPPPPPQVIYERIIGVNNVVSDASLLQSMWIFVVLGTLWFLGFSLVHRKWIFYKIRLHLDSVSVPPPKLEDKYGLSILAWMVNVLLVDDLKLLSTAGLDALMLVKVVGLGVKIFVPFTFIGLVVLVPVHRYATKPQIRDTPAHSAPLNMYSMANLADGHKIFWLHFVLMYVYIFYVLALLRWQYYNYVKLRQHHMVAGNDVNYWRQVMAQSSFSKQQEYYNLMASLDLVRNWKRTRTSEGEEAPDPSHSRNGSSILDVDQIHAGLPLSRSISRTASYVSSSFRSVFSPVGKALHPGFSRSASPPPLQVMPSLASGTSASKPAPDIMSGMAKRTPSDTLHAAPDQGGRQPQVRDNAGSFSGFPVVQQVGPVGRPAGRAQPGLTQGQGSNRSAGPLGEGTEQNGQLDRNGKKVHKLPLACKEEVNTGIGTQRSDKTARSWHGKSDIPLYPLTPHQIYHYDTVDGAKWWTRVLVHSEPNAPSQRGLLSKPSVRHRTSVNTINRNGELVSVNAAQYTVLVTDVPEQPYLGRGQRKRPFRFRFSLLQRGVASLPSFLAVPLLRYIFLTDVQRDDLRSLLARADQTTDKIIRMDQSRPNRDLNRMDTALSQDGSDPAMERFAQLHSSSSTSYNPSGRHTRAIHSPASTRMSSFAQLHGKEHHNRPPGLALPRHGSGTSPCVSHRGTSADTELVALSPGSSTSYHAKSPPAHHKPNSAPKAATATAAAHTCCWAAGCSYCRRGRGHGPAVKGEAGMLPAPTVTEGAQLRVDGRVPNSMDSPFHRYKVLPTVLSGVPVDEYMAQHGLQSARRTEERSHTPSLSGKGTSSLNGQEGGQLSAGGSKWDVVREALENGRLFQLPQDIVTRTFSRLFPNDFDRAVPVFRHDQVDYLLARWDYHQRRLEHALTLKAQDGREPQERVCCDCCCLCCNCCACCSLRRDFVNSIPYHEQCIDKLKDEILAAQQEALSSKVTPSYIAFFKTQLGATLAANSVLHAEDQTKFQVHAAPGPENVNWEVLWFSFAQREARAYMAFPVKFLVLFFPISILSGALTSLDMSLCPVRGSKDSKPLWPYYCQNSGLPILLRLVISALLPSVLLSIWQNMVIPRSLYFVAQMESESISLSGLEGRILELYYIWSVLNVIQGVLGQVLTTMFRSVLENPGNIFSTVFDMLGKAIPNASNFFFNYVWFRGVCMLPYRMLVPHMGFWCFLIHFGGRWCTASRRDEVDLFTTRSIRHGIELGLLLYIFTVGFVYCLVSPLLCPVVLVYFCCAYVLWRNSTLYLNVRKYESGGSLWPRVFDRLLVCLFLMQLFMTSLMLVKQAYYQAILLLFTVPFILRRFRRFCHMTFEMGVKSTPLELAKDAPAARVDPTVYIPPPLQPGCVGWHPEWMKAWEGFGEPMFSA